MIILSLLNGSRLYDTNDEGSDYDIINVYMKDVKDYYLHSTQKINRKKIQVNKYVVYDMTYIDVVDFAKQLLRCNPNFLIPFLKRSFIWTSKEGRILMENARYFIDGENTAKAFIGCAQSMIRHRNNREAHNLMINFLGSIAAKIQDNKDDFYSIDFDKTDNGALVVDMDKCAKIFSKKADLSHVKNVLDIIINKEG